MTLIFREAPPEPGEEGRFRGTDGTVDIYVKHGDTLTNVPPHWTLRGYLERGPFPIHRQVYDTGMFTVPTSPEMDAAYRTEFHALNAPLAPYVIGLRLEVDGCMVIPQIAVHPDHREQGHMSGFLNNLSRRQTIVFPEVLPQSVMPAILQRRGFRIMFVADSTDDLHVFFPCYVRMAK